MKIIFSSLERTNLSCPSEWEGSSECAKPVRIHYRTGRISIYLDGKLEIKTSKDDFDIASYMDDEDLKAILQREDLLSETE
jgi:hypothetical protein